MKVYTLNHRNTVSSRMAAFSEIENLSPADLSMDTIDRLFETMDEALCHREEAIEEAKTVTRPVGWKIRGVRTVRVLTKLNRDLIEKAIPSHSGSLIRLALP